MNDHYPHPAQPWSPSFEAWPGGPHPGAIAMMLEDKRLREEAEFEAAAPAVATRLRTTSHLLLLR